MDDLYDINELMTFLDLEESNTDALGAKPQLPVLRAVGSRKKQSVASMRQAAPVQTRGIHDRMALMKLAVESNYTIEERLDTINASLQHDMQNVQHYRLPTELVLSNI